MKENHLHKVVRMNVASMPGKKYYVFKCILDGCSFYRRIKECKGMKVICNDCENEMILEFIVSRPVCKNCSLTTDYYDNDILQHVKGLKDGSTKE